MNGYFLSKAIKVSSLSWRRDNHFSMQNGKDHQTLEAARAWQKKTIKKRTIDESNDN
jgi:hypothetical protein